MTLQKPLNNATDPTNNEVKEQDSNDHHCNIPVSVYSRIAILEGTSKFGGGNVVFKSIIYHNISAF